jgi:hypothetical protein
VCGKRLRGPFSLVSTTEELLGIKSSGCGLETEITAVGIHRADYATPTIRKKLALTLLTSGGCSVSIVGSSTSHNNIGLHGLIQGQIEYFLTCCNQQNTYPLHFDIPMICH